MSQEKYIPQGLGLNGDEDKGVRIPCLCFDGKYYIVHFGNYGQLSIQQKAWSAVYHSCPPLMLTQHNTGAGLRLKAGVDSPAGMWASLSRLPSHTATTLANIKGLLLFLCFILSPFLLSQQSKSELHRVAQNATNTAWLV